MKDSPDLTTLTLDIYRGSKLARANCSLCIKTPGVVHFHASSAGMCLRKQEYQKLFPDFSMGSLVKGSFLADGIIHENSIADSLEGAGHTVSHRQFELKRFYQSKAKAPVIIVGHMDFLVDDELLFEVKAVGKEAFDHYVRLESLPTWYLTQLQIYLDILGIEWGVLCVKSRQSAQMKLFEVRHSPDFMPVLVEYLYDLQIALWGDSQGNPILIERNYKDDKNEECKNCSFYTPCWEGNGWPR